jgi:hypothetical protein
MARRSRVLAVLFVAAALGNAALASADATTGGGGAPVPQAPHARTRARRPRIVREGTLPAPNPHATCPPEMALVDGRFCVDRWEASLVEMVGAGVERPWSPFAALPDGTRVRAVSRPGVVPQAYVSGVQAADACAAAHKRLCNPTEWRAACMGPSKTMWGYGASHEPGRCNDASRVSPMYHFYPQVKSSWRGVGMAEMNDPRLDQLEGTLRRTGDSPGCTNEYGVYDMVGNLHEWTDDPNGTFQGGWYLDTTVNGDGCGYRTDAHGFDYHDYSTGFRCCKEAWPAP